MQRSAIRGGTGGCDAVLPRIPLRSSLTAQSSSNIKIGVMLLFFAVAVTGMAAEAVLLKPAPLVAVSEHW